MTSEIKESWLKHNIGKGDLLYRHYRSYQKKIVNINRIFYHHRKCNIPMHPDTLKMCEDKIKVYLKQMDKLWYVMVYDDLPHAKWGLHKIVKELKLGTWENYVYISFYVDNKSKFPNLRKIYQEKKNAKKVGFFDKIKSIFK